MEMSQIAIIASEDVLLTELTHLTNGKIEAAVACFADEFTFNDHGIGLEFKDKERLAEFFHKTRELYPDSFLQTDAIFRKWRPGDHRMDSSIYLDGALLRSPLTKASSLAARSLDRANSQWENHEPGGLLRRTNFPPHSPGFVFHRMGRTVKRW